MLPNVCEEVATLVVATLQADHELVVKDILQPIMVNLREDLVANELSTTAEARIFWNFGILMKCVGAVVKRHSQCSMTLETSLGACLL